jgi:hypothetical protein
MAYSRVAANLLVDYPHVDGMLTTLYVGRDWQAIEPRRDTGGFSPDVEGQYGWYYDNKFEYLERLGGIAPLGKFTKSNMALTDWDVVQGKWRESPAAASLGVTHLWYYDARAGRVATNEYGILRSKASYAPNLMFWFWRMGGAYDETDQATIGIHLAGADAQYALYLPAYREAGSYYEGLTGTTERQDLQPVLMGKASGDSNWAVIDTLSASSTPTLGSISETPKLQTVRIEYADETLLVRMGENDNAWAYRGLWSSRESIDNEFALTSGQVEVRIIGHTALFAMAPITYPASAKIYPHRLFVCPPPFGQTQQYIVLAATPTGTAVTAAVDSPGGYLSRPEITMTTTDTSTRPVLYCVQEHRDGVIGSADTVEVDTQGNNTVALKSVRGTINENWRGSSITAQVEAKPGYILGDIAPNAKVRCNVSTNDGASSYRQFTGYITPPEKLRGSGPLDIQGTVQAEDIIEARLSKKSMSWHCSYEGTGNANGWNVASAFTNILHSAGVPDSLIDIHEDVSLAGMGTGYYMPSGSMMGKRRFKFGPDIDVVTALDTIVQAVGIASTAYPTKRRGLAWGVNQNGVIFLKPAYERTPGGAVDYTLDEDTATAEDFCSTLKSTRSLEDFRNLLIVMAGEGADAARKILSDQDSWSDPTAQTFIGDIWQRFVCYPDGADIEAISEQLWREVGYWHWLIEVTLHDNPDIMPEHNIKVQVANMDIPTDSVFKVVSKDWSCNENGLYEQTLTCVMVESG